MKIFKLICFNLCFLLCSFSFGQSLNEDNIYLICRGTKNKQNLIAEKFNSQNKEATHIGIGIVENDSLSIFNISIDKKVNQSSLIIEKWNEFTNLPDIFYLSVWEIESDKEKIIQLKSILNNYFKEIIDFDYNFSLDDDNNLYCSEFVAKVLNKLNIFHYETNKKPTNSLLKNITDKEEFEYFPVDFFLQNPQAKQIYLKTINIK